MNYRSLYGVYVYLVEGRGGNWHAISNIREKMPIERMKRSKQTNERLARSNREVKNTGIGVMRSSMWPTDKAPICFKWGTSI